MSKKSKIILISALALLLAALIAVLGIVIFGGKDNNDKDSASSVDSKTESTVSKTDTPAIYDREETTPNENENVSKIEIDKTKPSVTVENYETALGKTIEIPVKINNNPGISSAALEIQYNTHKLKYMGYDEGEVFEDYRFVDAKDCLYFINAEGKNVDKNGILFTLKFKVKDDAAIGNTEIKIKAKDESFATIDEEFVDIAAGNAIITIK